MRELKANMNMIRAHLSIEEKKEKCSKYQKEWREINHKEVIEKHRKYNDTHKEQSKAYREANKEEIKRETKNIEKLTKKRKKKVIGYTVKQTKKLLKPEEV
jgi:uncharacterized FlaG/YvyC family protein